MILSFELPIKYLNHLGQYNDFHFCLAHLALSNSDYLSYYRNQTKYKVLDNSSFELKKSVSFADILKAAELLNAQEVCAPDVFKEAAQTIESTREFIDFMKNSGVYNKFKIMGVVQGENIPAWMQCLNFMNSNSDVHVIGVSYIGCEVFNINKDVLAGRLDAITAMMQHLKVRKPIHLLGIGGNPIEIKLYGPIPNLRSCDTSLPVVNGIDRIRFDLEKGSYKVKRQNDFFNITLDKGQLDDIIYNIQVMKQWIS